MNPISAYLHTLQIDPSTKTLKELSAILAGMGDDWRKRPDTPSVADCPYNPSCGGAGWFRYNVEVGHPLFGQGKVCQCTIDKKNMSDAQRLEKYRQQMSAVEQTWTLTNWIGSDENARQVATDAVKSMCGIKVFLGDFGRGKSGLLTAIVNSCLERKVNASYVVVNDLLIKLRASYDPKDLAAFDRAVSEVCRVRVLALDEMWEYKASEWTEQTLRTILDERYRYADERLTVIGSNENKMPDEGAIASRLNDSRRSQIVRVSGPDLRPLAAKLAPPPIAEVEDWVLEDADAYAAEQDERFSFVAVTA